MGNHRSCAIALVLTFITILAMPPRAAAGFGSIGQYFNGCMDVETRLTGFETGLLKIFPERERGYGNPQMIDLLARLGTEYARSFPAPFERLQVGDISDRWGGGLYNHHASHQNGLDVDVVYLRQNLRELPDMRENFVRKGRVTRNFDVARNWWVFRWLVRTGQVDRIFVAKGIKEHLCRNSQNLEHNSPAERVEILRRLRPIRNHENHFHLRLLCPEGDVKCVGTPPLPEDHGCGKDFKGLIDEDVLDVEEDFPDEDDARQDGVLEPSFLLDPSTIETAPAPAPKKPRKAPKKRVRRVRFRECREIEKKQRAERKALQRARRTPLRAGGVKP